MVRHWIVLNLAMRHKFDYDYLRERFAKPFLLFANHGRALTGESPEHAKVVEMYIQQLYIVVGSVW